MYRPKTLQVHGEDRQKKAIGAWDPFYENIQHAKSVGDAIAETTRKRENMGRDHVHCLYVFNDQGVCIWPEWASGKTVINAVKLQK